MKQWALMVLAFGAVFLSLGGALAMASPIPKTSAAAAYGEPVVLTKTSTVQFPDFVITAQGAGHFEVMAADGVVQMVEGNGSPLKFTVGGVDYLLYTNAMPGTGEALYPERIAVFKK